MTESLQALGLPGRPNTPRQAGRLPVHRKVLTPAERVTRDWRKAKEANKLARARHELALRHETLAKSYMQGLWPRRTPT